MEKVEERLLGYKFDMDVQAIWDHRVSVALVDRIEVIEISNY